MNGQNSPQVKRRVVQVFARDPAYCGELGEVPIEIRLRENATTFDDAVIQIRRAGSVLPPGQEGQFYVVPIPFPGFKPSVVDDQFKAQMLFAVIQQTRAFFCDALGRETRWWREGPLVVRFDCREAGDDLVNAYYRRLPAAADARSHVEAPQVRALQALADDLGGLLECIEALGSDDEPQRKVKHQASTIKRRARELGSPSATALGNPNDAQIRDDLLKLLQPLLAAITTTENDRSSGDPALAAPQVPPLVQPTQSKWSWLADRSKSAGAGLLSFLDNGTWPGPVTIAAERESVATVAAPPRPAIEIGPRQELRFGVYRARPSDFEQTGALVSTSLMHDVIVHEAVHALLDGLRPQLFYAPNAEAMAFHEGFADLIAVFSRFANRELVRAALARSENLGDDVLVSIGTQFGFTATEHASALRSAIADDPDPWSGQAPARRFDPLGSAHALGTTLLSAVFAAFRVVFRDKSARLRALAGASPSAEALDLLAARASQLGMQFLGLLIRAIDFLPPVDARFGDYLRAVLTADAEDYPDDEWRYRERLVEQFRRYRIPVVSDAGVGPSQLSMHASALQWQRLPELPADEAEDAPKPAISEAHELLARSIAEPLWRGNEDGKKTAQTALLTALTHSDSVRDLLALDRVAPIQLGRSWESARVVDGHRVVHERGIELLQMRTRSDIGRIYGGTTVILRQQDSTWHVRYAIYRRVGSAVREDEQRRFLAVCDRGLERAWRGLRSEADLDQIAQQLTRHLHQAGHQGESP